MFLYFQNPFHLPKVVFRVDKRAERVEKQERKAGLELYILVSTPVLFYCQDCNQEERFPAVEFFVEWWYASGMSEIRLIWVAM